MERSKKKLYISIISESVLLLVRDWGSNPKHPTRWEFFCNLSKSLGPLLKNISLFRTALPCA